LEELRDIAAAALGKGGRLDGVGQKISRREQV